MSDTPRARPAEVDAAVCRLDLVLDGPVTATASSHLAPVSWRGLPAFLKIAHAVEELTGLRALELWDGGGAVQVLARDGDAAVLERAGRTLLAAVPDDAASCRVLCGVARRLHGHSFGNLSEFPTLRAWFAALFEDTDPRFGQVRTIADRLLATASAPVLLHGDLHHENILDGGERGWLAIDPKGIVGPREFDYCNLFTNPAPDRALRFFDARLELVSASSRIEPATLTRWIAAWSALSGLWYLEDGDEATAEFAHSITELALRRMSGLGG